MKNVVTAILVLAVIASGIFFAMKLKVNEGAKTARTAENAGDYKEALSQYVNAYLKLIPGVPLPDINRSKTLPPASWKKEMAQYAVWSLEKNSKPVNEAKKRQLLEGVLRNEVRVDTQNFLNTDSIKTCTPEKYLAVWNSAFFARGVAVNPDQAPLVSDCFGKSISILIFSARTSYIYEISLVDTLTNRQTSFTVYPESSTSILVAPGNSYILFCTSTFQPAAGQIWRSNPSVIPLTVPPATSIMGYLIETSVKK